MPLVASNKGDVGLGYYATCDCHDFGFRSETNSTMTQKQINSRWDKARDKLRIEGAWQDGDTWAFKVAGGSEVHDVFVCRGNESPGPNFMCKHVFCALTLILEENEGLDALAFGCPSEGVSHWGETISIDGWMVVLIKKRKEKDE